ncbi:MAG: hypothetical protein HYY84_20020 [Deltaproteobacteria bacterium]|nr:hypothetical protein [Deltaproteobacteria bacterium]
MNAPQRKSATHLTVRGLSTDVARALEREKTRRRKSLNETVKDLLRQSLGITADAKRDNGLGKFAGDWSDADLREFERATKSFEQIDPELWR